MSFVYLFLACAFCYSCSFLFVVFGCVFFFCSHWSLVDVPLIFFCPADHVPDWQPRILLGMVDARSVNVKNTTVQYRDSFKPSRDGLFFFSLISLIADGPHHYHPACGHKGYSHLSPVHALQFFYRDASSALLQLVNQSLNLTYSRSHAFRYERKNTNPTLVRIEPMTSALAGVQVTY